MTKYPLKKFDSILTDEAQLYGPGAFDWEYHQEVDTLVIRFLTSETYHLSDKYVWEHAQVKPKTHWKWDENMDKPNLSPSILIKSSDGKNSWKERFHGYIRNGYLEIL